MAAQTKKKLCWNCEGRVSFQDENCPYCGVYISPLGVGENENKESLFSPPYKVDGQEEERHVPASPYPVNEEPEPTQTPEAVVPSSSKSENPFLSEEVRTIVLPLVLLLSGSAFFLFGIALLLFSQNGVFTLQWNGGSWYLFLLCALPMLFFGWRYLQQDNSENS